MTNLNYLLEGLKEKEVPDTCKGLFFRGRHTQYLTERGFGERQELILLKRKSCEGCPKCVWMLDELGEQANERMVLTPDIEDGGLYKLIVTNISTDWETGYVDSYNLEFIKI